MNFHHFLSFFFLGNDIKDFLLNCAKNHFNPCLLLTPVSLPHPPWNAESNLKWIFDFEYVPCEADLPEDVKFQYSKTGKSEDFKRDQENLDEYLQSLNHAHWQVNTWVLVWNIMKYLNIRNNSISQKLYHKFAEWEYCLVVVVHWLANESSN